MSHERNSLSEQVEPDETEALFKNLLEESQKELAELRAQITTGEGIFDPIIQKKKELFVKIKLIRQKLKEQWKHLQKEEKARAQDTDPVMITAKNKLITVMQDLKDIILLIKNLTVSEKNREQEIAAKKQIQQFNENTEIFYQQIFKLFTDYQSLERNIHRITNLKYGEDISDYMNYTTVTLKALVTVALAWASTLGEAAQAAGAVFYPISATFTSSAKLFRFLGSATQFFIASNEADKEETSELRKLELDDTRALLRKSATFKFLAFSFSALSAMAFAGVLATPLGWAFVAVATLVDWIDDGLGASQRADKALQKFKTEHAEKLEENDGDTLRELNTLQEKARRAKSEAQWGFANTVAMVLIACGPIPFAGPFLGLAGLATFGIVSIRNAYVAAKPYMKKYFATTTPGYLSTEETNQEQKITVAPTAENKQGAALEVATSAAASKPVQVAQQFREILTPSRLEKASLVASLEKPDEKPDPAAAKKSPGLFNKAANDKSLSPTTAPKMGKKTARDPATTRDNRFTIKGG